MKVEIYFDGACDSNSKFRLMGIGVAVFIDDKYIERYSKMEFVGTNGTNNVAEYMAFISSLQTAQDLVSIFGEDIDLTIYGDSKLVVEQVNGRWKVKSGTLRSYWRTAKELMTVFGDLKVNWISRDYNTVADRLSKQGLQRFLKD